MPAPQPPKNSQSTSPAAPASKPKAKAEAPKLVRVRATRLGIYNNARVRPGTVFNFRYAPGTKMPSWVEEVDDDNNPLNGFSEEQSEVSEPDKGSSSDNVI